MIWAINNSGKVQMKEDLIALVEKWHKSEQYVNPHAALLVIEAIEIYGGYDTDALHDWLQTLISM